MKIPKPISPFRLSSLLGTQKDPTLAFNLVKNPNPDLRPTAKPFRYSLLSYDLIITKLGRVKMFQEMEQVLHQLKSDTRIVPEEIIFCNVIKFYGRAKLHERALQLFDEMPQYRCPRTVKAVNSLLHALLKSEKFDDMKQVFLGMEKYARPDACTYNILIHACCLNGCLDDAWNLFDEMQRKGVKPDKIKEAFKLKNDMVKIHKVSPNTRLYEGMITGLCSVGELTWALRLKDEMITNNMKPNSAMYNTLISGLFNVGRQDEAYGVFDEMELNGIKPDTTTYNVMINELCKMGNGVKQMIYSKIYQGRQGCKPDVVSYRMLFDGLCGGSQLKKAAFILDEMVFKGYVPHSASTWLMVVSRVFEEDDHKLCIASQILDDLLL
ncbi:hypothetical protein GOBAR_AA14181 [Gossypium barbadense]|uniref:Pentacotripeptide-repeat region of PRORP domain-containing protein n=1 Tax=Gossypium barbadense TaxID=3634 RepID=A0A2P5XSX1_GOSBA|nr:hypothetical protein GOBAR_AA14181 [Gossypium barbadense]